MKNVLVLQKEGVSDEDEGVVMIHPTSTNLSSKPCPHQGGGMGTLLGGKCV